MFRRSLSLMHCLSNSQKVDLTTSSVSPRKQPGFAAARQAVGLALLLGFAGAAQAAAPTFAKAFSPATIGPGSITTATFTINNGAEPAAVSGLAFTDNLPSGVTVATPAMLSSDCGVPTLSAAEGGSTISMGGGTLDAYRSCTLTVNVTSATAGTYTNPAITLSSSAGSSLSVATDLTVSTALPGFNKSIAPASVNLGARSTLTYSIDNSLNSALVGSLAFTDNLPSGMVVASPANASTDCEGTYGTTLTATPGASVITLSAVGLAFSGWEVLAAGASCTVAVDVVASSTGSWANTTELLADTVSAGLAAAALTVSADELVFYKSFTDDPVAAGGSAILRFDIINTNRFNAATAITFSDDLNAMLTSTTVASVLSDTCSGVPAGVGSGTFSYSGGSVAADGGACAIEISLNIPAAAAEGAYPSTSSTISASSGTFSAASETLFVFAAPLISKNFTDDPAVAGGTVTLEYTISNPSTTDAMTDIAFGDYYSPIVGDGVSLNLPVLPCGGTSSAVTLVDTNGTGLRLTGGSLAASASCTFTVGIVIPTDANGGVFTSTSDPVTATLLVTTRTGNQATDTLVVVSAPIFSKSFTDASVAPGGSATLEFNLGLSASAPGDVTSIAFSDDVAAMLAGTTVNSVVGDTCGGTPTGVGGGVFNYSGGLLTPDSSCTVSILLDVDAAAAPNTYTNTSSTITALADDGTTATHAVTGPAATDSLLVSGLVFSKEFIDDPALPGGTTTLRFTLDNSASPGGQDATAIAFTDSLTSALSSLVATGLPLSACGGTVSGTTSIAFSGGSVAAGASCTFDVTLLIPGGAADNSYPSSTSSLTATIGATGVVLPAATDTLIVQGENITLSKSFTNDPLAVGGTGTLQFVLGILATSPGTVDNISFTDDLDATLSGLTYSGGSTDCPGLTLSSGATVTVSGVSLDPGASCTITLDLAVPGTASAGDYSNSSSALSGDIGGLPVTGPAATDTLTVRAATLSQSFVSSGQSTGTVGLSFTIQNEDSVSAINGLAFSNDLSAALAGLVSITPPQADVCGAGSLFSGTSLLTLNNGSLDAGASCTINVTLQIPATTPGTYLNTTSQLLSSGLVLYSPATASLSVVNSAPTIDSAAVTSATEDSVYSYTFAASDVDVGDTLTYSAPVLPGWLTFTAASGLLSGTPGNAEVGDHSVTLRVNDGTVDVDQSFTLTVTNTNDAPTIDSAAVTTATEDSAYSYTFAASDVDVGDSLTYSAPVLPSWLSFNSGTSVLSGTPSNADVGANNVTLRVNDGTVDVDQIFTITVSNTNDAPVINSTAVTAATQDTSYSYTFATSDVDVGDTLTYSAPVLPGWLSFDVASGLLSGTPGNAEVGDHSVTLRVNDGTVDVDQSFTLTVTNTNDAPTISGVPVTSVLQGAAYSFTPTGSDPDAGTTLTYSIINKPSWANFNTATGTLSGTPAAAGVTTGIVINVSDSRLSAALATFDLTVEADFDQDGLADNVDPDDDNDDMTDSWELANGLNPFDASDAALDSDGDGVNNLDEFTAATDPQQDDYPPVVIAPADVTVNAVGLFTPVSLGSASANDAKDGDLTPTSDALTHFKPGIHTVTWSATDAAGNTGTATQMVNVVPLVSFSKDQTTSEGATVNFSVILNGDAVNYPVSVPFSVSGTAATDGSDHTLTSGIATINSGTEVIISFTTVDDGPGEGSESIVITMGSPSNAVVGPNSVHGITLAEGNVAPLVSLNANQAPAGGSRIVTTGNGNVQVIASVTDANAGDTLSYDWSATDNALVDTDGADNNTFTFDPSVLTPGLYRLRISVTDSGGASAEDRLELNVVATAPVLDAANDSDSDTVDDLTEGYGDTDNDGVAEYLDGPGQSNVLSARSGISSQYMVETEPGLNLALNSFSLQVNIGQAEVVMSDLATYGGQIDDETMYAYPGGLFDFVITGLPVAGRSVNVVLPQRAPVPANAVYRKLIGGVWQDFVEDGINAIATAAGEEGFCPPPGDGAYSTGLTAGHWCVQLTIEDGGANDNDGTANKAIVDPGGVAQVLAVSVDARVSGGGALHPLWLLLLGLLAVPRMVSSRKGRGEA